MAIKAPYQVKLDSCIYSFQKIITFAIRLETFFYRESSAFPTTFAKATVVEEGYGG